MAAEKTQLYNQTTTFSQEGPQPSLQVSTEFSTSARALVERKALGYEREALKPITLRRGKYQEMIQNSERWVERRARLLRERLPMSEREGDGAEYNLRGFLLEMLGYEALNRICAESATPFRVLYAPFQLDMSTKTDKGGDLLLVREYEDGAYAPISLIDIKRHGGTEKLRSGMHWGINRALPTLVVPLSGMTWEDADNIEHDTSSFISNKMRRVDQQHSEEFLSLLSPRGQEQFLAEMRNRVTEACGRTQACIERQRYNTGLQNELLSKLAITQLILGNYRTDVKAAS